MRIPHGRRLAGLLLTLSSLSTPATETALTAPEQNAPYQLRQVILVSRHNLRTPLMREHTFLPDDKPVPQWNEAVGELTTKGGVLEVYMGHYLRQWLAQQGLTPAAGCPAPDSVFAYANAIQRTRATARFFLDGAWPGCELPVHHNKTLDKMDPVFNPIITDGSADFRQRALAAMENVRRSASLDDSYHLLARIIDYRRSADCLQRQQCDLTRAQDVLTAQVNDEPHVKGPLSIGNALTDAFVLQYYEGMPLKAVAWGAIRDEKDWRALLALKNHYQDTLFSAPLIARNTVRSLATYMDDHFIEPAAQPAPAIALLVGHDSNLTALLAALEAEPYQLPGQLEKTPIGGVLLFQRWYDPQRQQDRLKVEYVYQTMQQLRDATPLSLQTPPQRVTLRLKGCPADAQGFCAWQDFARQMQQLKQG